MKLIPFLFCLFTAGSLTSGIFQPSIAAIGADSDSEAIVQGGIEPASPLFIDVTLSNPCSSNTVLLAFGKDLNADGELSLEEISYQVGWDAGVWVEYASNAVDSAQLGIGISNNRLSKYLTAGDWDLVNLIVRGDSAGKVFVGKPPTIILIR